MKTYINFVPAAEGELPKRAAMVFMNFYHALLKRMGANPRLAGDIELQDQIPFVGQIEVESIPASFNNLKVFGVHSYTQSIDGDRRATAFVNVWEAASEESTHPDIAPISVRLVLAPYQRLKFEVAKKEVVFKGAEDCLSALTQGLLP